MASSQTPAQWLNENRAILADPNNRLVLLHAMGFVDVREWARVEGEPRIWQMALSAPSEEATP